VIPILGQLINKQYTYEAILCDPRKNELTILSYSDLTYSPKFKTFSELDIELQYYEEGHLKVKDKNFDLTKGLYLIKLNIKNGDNIVKSEFFFIENPKKNMSDGVITKSLHCYSYEYLIFNKKKLRGYNQTRKLYDPVNDYDINDSTKGGILNLLIERLYGTWQIGYFNPIFENIYHTFDFADSTYTEVFSELQKGYNCTILFNNVEQTINVYTNEEIGVNRDLVLSDYNYIKSISNEDKFDEIKSRLYIYGKDNLGINRYNPTGLSYLESYDFFINNGYFSSSLATAWNNYKALIASKQGQFEGYITQLENYEASLLQKQNELVALKTELAQIEDALDVEKNTYSSNSDSPNYDDIYDDLQSKEIEIEDKEDEIDAVQANINSVNSNITALQNTLSYANNFSQEELEELVNFVFEDTLNMSQVSNAEQLYTYGLAYLEKISTVPITFDVDSIDIFSTQEGQNDWNKITIGDYININVPELGFDYYPIRLVGINHNPISNSLSMTFSNTDKIESDILYLNDIFKLSNKVAVEVEVKKYEYERYSNDSDRVLYNDSILTNTIQMNNNNVITRRGFIGTDLGGFGKIQLLSDKIIFSQNNFEDYYTLLSANGLYLESQSGKSRLVITPEYGIQIDKKVSGQWDNVFYVDSNGNVILDGGYIQLLTEDHMNTIKINPLLGIEISRNIGTVGSPLWDRRFFVDTNGNLIAKQLRTSSSSNDYVSLEEQFIDFYNDGLKKLQLGFQDISGTSYPYMIWGAGDGGGLNQGFILKTENMFSIRHRISTYGEINSIDFMDSSPTFPLGAIVFNGYVDLGGASGEFESADGQIITIRNGMVIDIDTI
jgi:hypothetical protein